MTRREQILSGLTSQNEQATFQGRKGFWIQTDCVFIEADDAGSAISKFRKEMGRIACNHNFGCSAICKGIFANHLTDEQYKEARKEIKL